MAGTTEIARLETLRRWMASNRVLSCTTKDVTLVLHESSLFPMDTGNPDKVASPKDDYGEETPHQKIRRLHAAKGQREQNGDTE